MNNAIICNNIQFLLRPQAPFLESLTGWVGSPNWTCFFYKPNTIPVTECYQSNSIRAMTKNYKQLHKENGSFGDKWHQFILRTGYPSCHPTSQPAVSDKKGNIMHWPPTTQLLQISPSQYLKKTLLTTHCLQNLLYNMQKTCMSYCHTGKLILGQVCC